MIDTRLRRHVQKIFDCMAGPLIAMGLSPIQITLTSAVLGLIGCGLTMGARFPFRMAAIAMISLSALFDILDGTVARNTGRTSPLGAFLDLILDRVVESCFIMAFAFAFPANLWPAMIFLTLMIVNFSAFLLAGHFFPNRGKKSMHYQEGLVERSETFLLFGLMLVFPGSAGVFLWIFNILMLVSAVIHFIRIIQYARAEGLDGSHAQ